MGESWRKARRFWRSDAGFFRTGRRGKDWNQAGRQLTKWRMNSPSLAVIAMIGAAALAHGQPADGVSMERARNAPVFTLHFENDYFGGQDQHYTNGMKLSWVTGDLSEWGKEGWRQTFLEAVPFVNRPDRQKNLGVAVGQNIYTPQDTSLVIPDSDDRPYAGRGRQTVCPSPRRCESDPPRNHSAN